MSNRYTIFFITILCTICAIILAGLSLLLKKPQELAARIYRYEQLLISAKLIEPGASNEKILNLYQSEIEPILMDEKGDLITFEKARVDFDRYIQDYSRVGFSKLPLKLIYVIKGKTSPAGYIIPVNGYGLWGPIYGYLSLEPDATTVTGMTWYEQSETPGLGGEIATPKWQAQFDGKEIYPPSSGNLERANLGIRVVKGKGGALAQNEVDAITGASITSDGVAVAIKRTLDAYRPFIVKANRSHDGVSETAD